MELGKEWCRIGPHGEIEFIDWDEADRLAELHRDGTRRDLSSVAASLAVGVREYMLRTRAPEITRRDRGRG